MTNRHDVVLGLPEFLEALTGALDLGGHVWEGPMRLGDDAGLDSLDMYEVVCTVEAWTGAMIADELLVTWETFDDVYRCYRNNLGAGERIRDRCDRSTERS